METKMKITFLAILAIVGLSCLVHAASIPGVSYATATLMNQDPDPAEPGKYVELRWKVEAQGSGTMGNLTYKLNLSYPFYFDGSDTPERQLGDWQGTPGGTEYFTLYYKIRVYDNVPEDTYKVSLLSAKDNTDSWIREDFDVRIGEKNIPDFTLGQLVTSPTKLSRDTDSAKLAVEIANIGKLNADNVVVQAQLPEGFEPSYTYADRAALGTIAAGSSKTATFYVDIAKDAPGGIQHANLTITYKESGETGLKTQVIDLELPMQEKPMFEIINQSTVPEKVYPNQETELRLLVKNTGGEDADSVSIKLYKDSSQPLELVESSDFIGKLTANETGDALLKIKFDSDAEPKSYKLDVEIRSVYNNEVDVQRKTITIELADPNANSLVGGIVEGASTTLLIIFGLCVGAVGFVTYGIGKRHGKQ